MSSQIPDQPQEKQDAGYSSNDARVQELSRALDRLSGFQKKLVPLKKCKSRDDLLDQIEILLDEAVPFSYARMLVRNFAGELELARELMTDGIYADERLVEWACQTQEVAVIPVDHPPENEEFQSILLLPLPGVESTCGVIFLWVNFETSGFTRELRMQLSMLAREAGAVLDTFSFRDKIEEAATVLRNMVESVPMGILAMDAAGQINLLNATIEYMLNIRRADVMGRPYAEVLPPAVAEMIAKLEQMIGAEEEEISIDLRGIEEKFGLTLTPVGAPGHSLPVGYVVVCRDLKLSHEVKKLRQIDSMKNDFLSLVSHELRTPLTSIMAYSETLLMEGMVDDEKERREYLQIIYDEGERLTRLINDVLDLTKMEAGKMDYFFEEYDISLIIRNAVMNSTSLASQKKQNLTSEVIGQIPTVRLDKDRIMQVLMNFLSNAIKFTPEEGSISVKVEALDSQGAAGGIADQLRVSVTDTGIGISQQNLNKVFSKFEQIESIDHHSTGTGLGMPICRQIIEEGHGGKIWVESEPEIGSTFFFTIPVS